MDQLTKFLATTRGRIFAGAWGVVVLGAVAVFALNLTPGAGAGAVKAPKVIVHHPHPKTAQPISKPGAPQISSTIPPALAASLIDHEVSVVEIYNPGDPSSPVIDDLEAHKEAKAGAGQAGAGFVSVDVRNEAEMQAVASLVTASSDPYLFILDRHGDLLFQRAGYLDAGAIAQAATDALAGAEAADQAPKGATDGINGPYDGYWKAKVDQVGCKSLHDPALSSATTDAAGFAAALQSWRSDLVELEGIRAVGPDAPLYPQILADIRTAIPQLAQMAAASHAGKAGAFNRASAAFAATLNHLYALEAKAGIACYSK